MRPNAKILACLAACCLFTGIATAAAQPPARRHLHVYHRPPLRADHVRRRLHFTPYRHDGKRQVRLHRGRAHPVHRYPTCPRLAPPPPLPALRAPVPHAAPAMPHRDVTSTWQPYSYP